MTTTPDDEAKAMDEARAAWEARLLRPGLAKGERKGLFVGSGGAPIAPL